MIIVIAGKNVRGVNVIVPPAAVSAASVRED